MRQRKAGKTETHKMFERRHPVCDREEHLVGVSARRLKHRHRDDEEVREAVAAGDNLNTEGGPYSRRTPYGNQAQFAGYGELERGYASA